ncbi:MAG TPA: hypothetical protein VJ927_03030 [Actinomycetota bacterium]|nr:hypothetical protein [Actinomycetota bacterium]
MPQANAIILRIRTEQSEEFERLFEAEELPIWDEFISEGKFLKARLARIEYGTEDRDDVALYLIYAEVPGMAEHSAHDRDPRFNAFLEKARQFQPEPPSVFGGDVIFEREAD